MKKKFQLGIWDIDGTLADSLAPTIEAFHQVLQAHFGRPVAEQEIAAHFGLSELKMIENMVGLEKAPKVYAEIRQTMQKNMQSIQPYPGVLEALAHLKQMGLKLAVYTGRGREGAEFLLNTLKIKHHFDVVLTNDDVTHPKPHPEGVLKACTLLQIQPVNAFMIGDSHMDIEAAIDAGTFAVGCTWDKRSTAKNSRHAAQAHFVGTSDELLAWLGTLG